MIDVLYIVGTGSLFNDAELKYSLRSLDKHGLNIDRVIISGHCPGFVDKSKVIHVECDDISTPAINHWWKTKQAFDITDAKKVVCMYDDIFFCKDVDLENYPYYRRNEELPENDRVSKWGHVQYIAGQWLKRHNYTAHHYGLHLPMIYEKDKFEKLNNVFQGFRAQGGVSVRSMYGNIYAPSAEAREDVKFFVDYWNLDEWLKDKECFSTAPENFIKAPKRWLDENFPNKSRWEK